MDNSEGVPVDGVVEDDAVRFEDLTVDDDLPLLERIVRYSRSQIALQRLVHVKMLAETAEIVGQRSTQEVMIPLLRSLVADPESIIRQHVSTQLVPVSIVCMMHLNGRTVEEVAMQDGSDFKALEYDEKGYSLVTKHVVGHLKALVQDVDLDVRRAAADALSSLARHLRAAEVPTVLLPIPVFLAGHLPTNPHVKKKSEQDQHSEELRIAAGNLLAELGGAASEYRNNEKNADHSYVEDEILPAVLTLCEDTSFRVRRSAAQALPRVLGACRVETVKSKILPAFDKLSQDDLYRVRKSTGECLVDMSRSTMILSSQQKDEKARKDLQALRRAKLIPIADRLIQDSHKMVRQGMMQFLGPFMASFYPYQNTVLRDLLPTSVESDGSNHLGIVAQFFPHATSMVSRLNSAQTSSLSAPTPVNVHLDEILHRVLTEMDLMQKALPSFIQASRMSSLSLAAVATHRHLNLPAPEDVESLMEHLLDYFAALAIVSTGDENTDAEMRVYCAYSFPAIVLLLGPEHWEGAMRTCFYTLMNPNYAKQDSDDQHVDPPLPVKRCLASSLHTVAHILGPELAASDILPVVQDFFLKDSDESVRLNVIRNFPALLQVLPPPGRKGPFLRWASVVRGEELLGGSKKRSAHNPIILNWRQRDYLARSLPDLIILTEPELLREHIWPILQVLLQDTVSLVRDDAIWSVAILFKSLCTDTLQQWPRMTDVRGFSSDCAAEIVEWLKSKILRLGMPKDGKPVNFAERQVYCRICGTLGLALRFSEAEPHQDPVTQLSEKFKSYFFPRSKQADDEVLPGPYRSLTKAEQKFLKRLLLHDLLPPALEMKEDRISNVRVTLMKTLQLMPHDIQSNAIVKPVLKGLVDDVETWENFAMPDKASQPAQPRPAKPSVVSQPVKVGRGSHSGPVDLDEVSATSSRDDTRTAESHASSDNDDDDDDSSSGEEDWQTVVFADGPIGMQLEPTSDDKACRVYGFLVNSGASPARESGKVNLGDVIVKVNNRLVKSYDDTIAVLKAGGRREITFRPGTEGDDVEYDDEGSGGFSDEDREERERKARKEAKKQKKARKEEKKKKSKDKEKSDKKRAKKKESRRAEESG